jgi:hypothetical protein
VTPPPHTIAEAWAACASDWHLTLETPGYTDARDIFYSGAASMLTMVAIAGAPTYPPSTSAYMAVLDLLQTVQTELKEYFDENDA